MSSTSKKIQEVRNGMIEVFGPNCWMGYKLDKKNPFTYHHIFEQRKGGKTTFSNGAILTYWAHQNLNELCNHEKKIYHELNDLFEDLNKSYAPPTLEYYKELNGILLRARDVIFLSKFNSLDVDYDLLGEMIIKAQEEGNVRGHMELVQEYYRKESGLLVPVSTTAIRKEEKPKVKKENKEKRIITDEEPIYIPTQYRDKVKHKNRRNKKYTYK